MRDVRDLQQPEARREDEPARQVPLSIGWIALLALALITGAVVGWSWAQAPMPGDHAPQPPLPIGNVWDHQDHQPTAAEIRAAEARRGVAPMSPVGRGLDPQLSRIGKSIDALEREYLAVPPARAHTGQ